MNIGDMAESIMNQGGRTPVATEYSQPVNAPVDTFGDQMDISNVEVPDSFMQKLLGEDSSPAKTEVQEEPQSVENDILSILYEEIQELKGMVSEMKTLITEQSGVGGLGVGMVGKCDDPFKAEQDRKMRLSKAFKKIAR